MAVRRRKPDSTVIREVTAINGVSWLLASDIDTVLVERMPSGKVFLLVLADRSVSTIPLGGHNVGDFVATLLHAKNTGR